jgi:hypothetical protein
MASENLGNLYGTKMPGYDDAADIQAALKIFLYGTTDSAVVDATDPSLLLDVSMAKHLRSLQVAIDEINARGAGSVYSATEPASPQDGYIWVNSSETTPVYNGNIFYQDTQPTGSVLEGSLWVDKDSSPLIMYVFDAVAGWREIGGVS